MSLDQTVSGAWGSSLSQRYKVNMARRETMFKSMGLDQVNSEESIGTEPRG